MKFSNISVLFHDQKYCTVSVPCIQIVLYLFPVRRMSTFKTFRQQNDYTLSEPPYVVVVYHVTIVAFGHGLLKKFWPLW